MKKIFKIAFASLLAFSIAPALSLTFNQNKDVTEVHAEETWATTDQVKYQDGDTVKDFRELPSGYTFNKGVLTVTSASTNDYSIWVEDVDAGPLTIIFERDYGSDQVYLATKASTLILTSKTPINLTSAYIDSYDLIISGKVDLNIVGNYLYQKSKSLHSLIEIDHFHLIDDASIECVDPIDYYYMNGNDLAFIHQDCVINTTGCFKIGFANDPLTTKDSTAYSLHIKSNYEVFKFNKCDGGFVLYNKDTANRKELLSDNDLKLNEFNTSYEIVDNKYGYMTIKPYKVIYDANGGSGEQEQYSGRSGNIYLPACTFTAPSGKQFKCWQRDGTSAEYNPGDEFYVKKDYTFYAIWEDATAALTGTVSITGSLKFGETLTAIVTDTNNTGTLSYQWRRNGEPISSANSSTYLVTEDDIGYTLSVVVTSSVESGSIVGTANDSISKADGPAAPTGITATACTTEANNDGVLKGVTTDMEYKLSSLSGWIDGTGSDITGLVSGTYHVRVKETNTHNASEVANVVVNAYNAPVLYSVTVNKGTANPVSAVAGTTITITADAPEDGYVFDKWVSTSGVTFADASSETTTFTMIEGNVTVTATYKPAVSPTPAPSNSGLGGGAIAGIVIASILVAGIAGFALVWFVIKKKTWADFLALFKKK